jgi:hypothetical protein
MHTHRSGHFLWTRGHVDDLATGVLVATDNRAADGLTVQPRRNTNGDDSCLAHSNPRSCRRWRRTGHCGRGDAALGASRDRPRRMRQKVAVSVNRASPVYSRLSIERRAAFSSPAPQASVTTTGM